MITKLSVKAFKTLEDVEIELGQVNVFIGANGSGKSNLLEAVGVLSAAADGKVDDQVLLQRGVRPGVPELYKSAFQERLPQQITFAAESNHAAYSVSLWNPLRAGRPWRYKAEGLLRDGKMIVRRSPNLKDNPNTERGMAALETSRLGPEDEARILLSNLQQYVIYSPTTPVLRGTSPETSPRVPVGLHGGRLPEAVHELLLGRRRSAHTKLVSKEALSLVDWAKGYGSADSGKMPVSAAAGSSERVIRFTDRYMREGRNVLSGYDSSEGALYVLLLAVLATHPESPESFAIDNADHGLNPRLAKALFQHFCQWLLTGRPKRQALLTTHNPLVLDGLPLQDDRVRLFTVSRTDSGRSAIRRVEMSAKLLDMEKRDWPVSRLWVMGHLGGMPSGI